MIIVGDSGWGKTSILMRYMDDLFEATIPTIGVDSRKKSVFLDENDEICLRIVCVLARRLRLHFGD